ncbi:LysM peptidoglycan-binding domain-containing protein [Vibrio sp. ZSDE26]|uniref:LysM peptidoglycan-binding domain-containing protein n=1 Tax=Vibrio amylolyticus TaxID=2847292 RepID=A0A9X1XM65_9VIBR|nr:LysM domain-containing protein [Vibrio amylolyticus]MCK6265797.1 LysM peptidoglycan-binding domain-containing protein [Vibrio amylolyticus]
MSKTYLVKPGDTLLQIAIEQNTQFNTLLELNPKFQINPDLIKVGEAITLPDEEALEPIELNAPDESQDEEVSFDECGDVVAASLCATMEVYDILFVTGESPLEYYSLDEASVEKLNIEVEKVNNHLKDYTKLCELAPGKGEVVSTQQAEQLHDARQRWYAKAHKNHILPAPSMREVPEKPAGDSTQITIRGKLAELEKRRRFVNIHGGWLSQQSEKTLKTEVLARIDTERAYYKNLVREETNESPTRGPKKATDSMPHHLVEVYSMKENKTLYIRNKEFDKAKKTTGWQQTARAKETRTVVNSGDLQGIGKAIVDDIEKDVIKKSLSPTLKDNLVKWRPKGFKGAEWKAARYILNDDKETVFAISTEAQMLRWAASGSVDAEVDVSEAEVKFGIGAATSFSLFEAKATIARYYPYENGLAVGFSFINANKETEYYPFGCFRLNGKAEIGCFVGRTVEVSGQAHPMLRKSSTSNTNQPNEKDEGGSSVGALFAPNIEVGHSPKGDIGFKVDVFQGAKLSGKLAGAMEWLPPEDAYTDKFKALAEISTEANVAIGKGFKFDFQLAMSGSKFYVYWSGRVVYGKGGGGSFGTEIDLGNLWDLAKIILQGLQHVDYRMLDNLCEELYEYLVDSTLIAFMSSAIEDPKQVLMDVVSFGQSKVDMWKQSMLYAQERRKTAQILATRIIDENVLGDFHLSQLQPEAVGQMLHLLVEQFSLSLRLQHDQEVAIYKLLAESTYSWHKFEEILLRMSVDGEEGDEVSLFNNLGRINAILNGPQQRDFNHWVAELAAVDKVENIDFKPYIPMNRAQINDKQPLVISQCAEQNIPHC